SDLSERTRKLIIATAVTETILKGAALIDIKRRPANLIRGPKWLWASVVAVVSSAGAVPISYFLFWRRRPPGGHRSGRPPGLDSGVSLSGALPGGGPRDNRPRG